MSEVSSNRMAENLKQWWPVFVALFIGAGGASSFFVTREQADAEARLAAAEARLLAAEKCWTALDLIDGAGTTSGGSTP